MWRVIKSSHLIGSIDLSARFSLPIAVTISCVPQDRKVGNMSSDETGDGEGANTTDRIAHPRELLSDIPFPRRQRGRGSDINANS
ncbi:hypothetical protein V1478_003579 [Vespula squamosa]|uniref:Uncharacterized protein n=1 Tax=Vespula squamosa TaxID=30214 RepID=A0ABD2BMA5_VESSQ